MNCLSFFLLSSVLAVLGGDALPEIDTSTLQTPVERGWIVPSPIGTIETQTQASSTKQSPIQVLSCLYLASVFKMGAGVSYMGGL